MQFEPEESGEERRRRQKDYHDFLDSQVEARKKHHPGTTREDDTTLDGADRLPVLPLSARLRHHPRISPYGVDPAADPTRHDGKSSLLNDSSAYTSVGRNQQAEIGGRDELLGRLEQRLEAEVQRRYLVERKLAIVTQKVGSTSYHLSARFF